MDSKSVHEEMGEQWEQITLPKALTTHRDETHVAHCMLWFRTSPPQMSHISYAFLQLRFDGLLGFPGGVVDEDITGLESIIDSLQREMREEINYSDPIGVDHYFHTFYNKTRGFVSHFFSKEITLSEAEKLEMTHMKARDFPHESLGLLRVPIGSSLDRLGSYQFRRFHKNFMRQKFSGNVRKQIIEVCEKFGLMSEADLKFTKSQL